MGDSDKCTAADLEDWAPDSVIVFLRALEEGGVSAERFLKLDQLYRLSSRQHPEIRFETLKIALELELDQEPYVGAAEKMLLAQGRMKYVRPLFRALDAINHERTVELFKRTNYHPICIAMVQKDLG